MEEKESSISCLALIFIPDQIYLRDFLNKFDLNKFTQHENVFDFLT